MVDDYSPLTQNPLTTISVLSFSPSFQQLLHFSSKMNFPPNFNSRYTGSQFFNSRRYVHFLPDLCGNLQSSSFLCRRPIHTAIFYSISKSPAQNLYIFLDSSNLSTQDPDLLVVFLLLNYTFRRLIPTTKVCLPYPEMSKLAQRNGRCVNPRNPPQIREDRILDSVVRSLLFRGSFRGYGTY